MLYFGKAEIVSLAQSYLINLSSTEIVSIIQISLVIFGIETSQIVSITHIFLVDFSIETQRGWSV